MASTPSRTKYYDIAYAPYGENYAGSGTTDLSYTGQNQDAVGGHYDFLYRELNPVHGRWISPDPAGSDAVDPSDPQSWNRYAYVANRPLNTTDPLGLCGFTLLDYQDAEIGCDDFGDDFGGPLSVNEDWSGGEGFGILSGENSINWPGPGLLSLLTDALGITGQDNCEFGPCGPGIPGASGFQDSVSAYHPSNEDCLGSAAIGAGEDLTGISYLPASDPSNWRWSSANFGFVYVGGESESLLSLSTGADVLGTAADFVKGTPRLLETTRQALRNYGFNVSIKAVSKDAAALGKLAGRIAKVAAVVTAYNKYQECRGN